MVLSQTMQTYLSRTPRSQRAHQRAQQSTPLGVHSNFRFYEPYPVFVQKANGTRIWDVDGHEYIDFGMGFGCLFVGHANPVVLKAVQDQLSQGLMYAMPHPDEAVLAQELLKRYPFLERVRLTTSGTETTMHAVRLARGVTGRQEIVKVAGSYHGQHDSVMAWENDASGRPVPMFAGILSKAIDALHIVPFNDLEALERVLIERADKIAAVITEPVLMNYGLILPQPGYLQGLQAVCNRYGVLLIFDEVKTGVKLAPGGACQYYDVQPDVVCLAKAIGGGMPLGAFLARGELMDRIEEGRVGHSGTYNAHPVNVAAGIATLQRVLSDDVYPRVEALNRRLVDGYNDIIAQFDLPAYALGVGPYGNVYFLKDVQGVPLPERAQRLGKDHRVFAQVDTTLSKAHLFGMLNEGIIPYAISVDCGEQWMLSVQHTAQDVERHVEAFAKVAKGLQSLCQQAGKVSATM